MAEAPCEPGGAPAHSSPPLRDDGVGGRAARKACPRRRAVTRTETRLRGALPHDLLLGSPAVTQHPADTGERWAEGQAGSVLPALDGALCAVGMGRAAGWTHPHCPATQCGVRRRLPLSVRPLRGVLGCRAGTDGGPGAAGWEPGGARGGRAAVTPACWSSWTSVPGVGPRTFVSWNLGLSRWVSSQTPGTAAAAGTPGAARGGGRRAGSL